MYQEEVCSEELRVEHSLSKRLGKNCSIETRWGSTIYHYEDLITPPEESAYIYGNYARKSEGTKIRPLETAPGHGSLPLPEGFKEHLDYMPTYEEFGFEKHIEKDERAALDFKGGETEGIKRLMDYMWNYKGMKDYKRLRNGFLGPNFSSKLSPWMANGCLSPREIYFQVKKWEQENMGENEHTKHFIAELVWRDFWHYWAFKFGDNIFHEYGHAGRSQSTWQNNSEIIRLWKEGMTGIPIIDAIQRDLNATGYISNRARQMTASYLCLDLQQDWRFG